ncbi:hypothetical protein Slin15195_G078510 [Septoria linicola]|uniref:Uncharacterized protein n=1 Tax=Septoria linicola TaxID=215465 RepID=A0A9Q9ARQ2_9PEZI|nr:hypothetical protein Slin14017_G039700 [Septoria linicola]USW54532.1 hypothetical protein Slin15195_G078510 [Septoria linicola]
MSNTKVPSAQNYDPGAWFWATRRKESSPLGASVWYLVRSLDIPLQYWLLTSGAGIRLLDWTGLRPVPQAVVSGEYLGLSAYYALIEGMAVGSSAKQIYWKAFIGEQRFPASFALIVAIYNSVLNSINVLLALWAVASQSNGGIASIVTASSLSVKVGVLLYAAGLFVEWYSEIQRKQFKADGRNDGKPYADGLWSLATNINYGGYTLWSVGFALVCGGCINRASPSMDAYSQKRLGISAGYMIGEQVIACI